MADGSLYRTQNEGSCSPYAVAVLSGDNSSQGFDGRHLDFEAAYCHDFARPAWHPCPGVDRIWTSHMREVARYIAQ